MLYSSKIIFIQTDETHEVLSEIPIICMSFLRSTTLYFLITYTVSCVIYSASFLKVICYQYFFKKIMNSLNDINNMVTLPY